jgi:hypothetical protein
MFFSDFLAHFPKIAKKETKVLTIDGPEKAVGTLPNGEYYYIFLYCNDPKCDCRRLMLQVRLVKDDGSITYMCTMSFGWEPLAYYKKEFPTFGLKELELFKGPCIDPHQTNTEYSDFFLDLFKTFLESKEYRHTIIRSYARFKWKIGMKLPKDLEPWLGSMSDCGCGSGEKFRFCCGRK